MDFLNTNRILLDAIPYPQKARGEFYVKKQIESGWSKSVFFSQLYESYRQWNQTIAVKILISKRKGYTGKEVTGIPLGPETNEEQTGELTKGVLEELRRAIDAAINWDKPVPEYSTLRILAMVEFGLKFINSQFSYQSKRRKWPVFSIRFPKDFKEGDYLFNTYSIAGEQLFFNFNRFRDEVRGLFLNTANKDLLERMLKPLFDMAVKNIDLWNEEIWPMVQDIQSKAPKKEVKQGQQLLEIDAESFSIKYSTIDPGDFKKSFHKFYQNQDFAIFSESIANFLGYLIINEKETDESSKAIGTDKKPSSPVYSLVLQYLDPLRGQFNTDNDFRSAVDFITSYFSGQNPALEKPIFIRNGNIRSLASALGGIWRAERNDSISFEYLDVCKRTFSIFKEQKFTQLNLRSSNMYKYFMDNS